MSPYPKYRQSSLSWLSDIPEHWQVNLLKRGFEVTLGKMLQPERMKESDFLAPYLRSANVQWGCVDISDLQEMWFNAKEGEQLSLENHDLVVCEGGDAGRAAIWKGEASGCFFQNSVNRVRSAGGNDTRYLMYWMSLIKTGGYVDILCNKSTISHLTKEKLMNLPMLYPPVDEQSAIGSYLDAETARIDMLISEKAKLVEMLQEMKIAAGLDLATRGLHVDVETKASGIEWMGNIPAHWHLKRNMFLFRERIENGVEGLPVLMVSLHSGVTEGQEDDDGSARVRKMMVDKTSYKRTRKGDVAYNMMRAWQGAIGAVPIDGLVSPAYVVLEPEPCLNSRYFELIARTSGYKTDFERYSYGIASFRLRLYWEGFKELKTPVPPINEQIAIVKAYDDISKKIDALVAHVKTETELLIEFRSATITDAVLGRIDVRNHIKSNKAREVIR